MDICVLNGRKGVKNTRFISCLVSRILKSMSDIYYGRVAHPWAINLENWSIDPNERLRIEEYKNDVERQLAAEL